MIMKSRITILLLMAFAGFQTYELHDAREQVKDLSMAAMLFKESAETCIKAALGDDIENQTQVIQ